MGKEKVFKCCICGGLFTGWGNNPDGAMWKDKYGDIVEGEFKPDDRCCDDCDNRFVIPGRTFKLFKSKEEKEGK